jgi:hypothetical protein
MAELRVVEPAKPTALEGLVVDYLASCRARGLSPKTIRDNYGYGLKSVFLPWAATEGITEPDQVRERTATSPASCPSRACGGGSSGTSSGVGRRTPTATGCSCPPAGTAGRATTSR